MPDPRPTVMISSTARDLPEHRKEVLDACMRQSMFPIMMEHLPASDAEAIEVSLRMVDQADIYLGIFAHRYGYVPAGHDISITEMEYNRAVELGIPRLIFLMHDDHPIKASDVEKGAGAGKLDVFKNRLKTDQVVNFFISPTDLRAHVINSVSQYRKADQTAFHYVSDIPQPPEPYIAHPYTLLQTSGLIGRQNELNLLTDWVAKPDSDVYKARILNVVAIGGMGKSALTWKWFNEIAPLEMQPLAGRMWWSFYESDATFENFVVRALAYVSRRPRRQIEEMLPPDRESQLLAILNREPFLIVLDGLERILIAYARMDAARLQDSEVDDQFQLRKTIDQRVGLFLRKLSLSKSARILVSTRLYPADLQDRETRDRLPGSFELGLRGLSDADALGLWRSFGVSGTRDEVLRIFQTFANHALIIKALAGEVKRFRRAPGDFDQWRAQHQQFDPARLPRVQEAMAHVLELALRGLDEKSLKVLHTIAAFRMPASYDTLAALLIGDDKSFTSEIAFDDALAELEDRGLLGWDKRANRYDLHPIVRGVVWSGLDVGDRHEVQKELRSYFEALPLLSWNEAESVDQLTTTIELYYTLVGLGRYDTAFLLFRDGLEKATLYRLSASHICIELLEMLFPDGLYDKPKLSDVTNQVHALNTLALAYDAIGLPKKATEISTCAIRIDGLEGTPKGVSIDLGTLAMASRWTGQLYKAELAILQALVIDYKGKDPYWFAVDLGYLGWVYSARGVVDDAVLTLEKSFAIFDDRRMTRSIGLSYAYQAQLRFWMKDYDQANIFSQRAWDLAHARRYPSDLLRAARLQGAVACSLRSLEIASERLHYALTNSRSVGLVQEELQALIDLAELRRRQGDAKAARDYLDDVWEPAERGPYPLFHADALNVLAQIERDAGNHAAAAKAVTSAYQLAWCDGPPYAYHWGLEAAKAHLAALAAPEPPMPPFDPSKYEPMPEIEIDPADELAGDE